MIGSPLETAVVDVVITSWAVIAQLFAPRWMAALPVPWLAWVLLKRNLPRA